MIHHPKDNITALKRKFRIWRCDIPRDNMEVDNATENLMGIFRKAKHPVDRMRNTWLYLKLQKDPQSKVHRTEIHDIQMSYFT